MENKFDVLCITGGMGVGKSTTLDYFSTNGFTIYNSDKIVIELFKKEYQYYHQLASHFDNWLGTNFVNTNGIDKSILRPILETTPNGFPLSVKVVAPFVQDELSRLLSTSNYYNTIVEIPLLVEMGMQHRFKNVLLITCDIEKRIKRIESRPPYLNLEKILQIIHSQVSDEERRTFCSYEINNSGTKKELIKKLDIFKEKYYA